MVEEEIGRSIEQRLADARSASGDAYQFAIQQLTQDRPRSDAAHGFNFRAA